MKRSARLLILATIVATAAAVGVVHAQQGALSAAEKTRGWDVENELQSLAVVERKVMMPMKDGVRLATDIYRPKNATGKVPTIWVRTPYNFNFWDIQNGVTADNSAALTAVTRGYAYVVQNERGHFFSEGNYDILGALASQQWAIVAPVAHCSYTRATADTIVGERSMGDARLDYNEIVYGFFDRFLKGEKSPRLDSLPKVTYYTMGLNKWQTADTWPLAGAQPMTFYLSSAGKANSLAGDGTLGTAAPDADKPDGFTYDPMNPVLSYGGNVCCTGTAVQAGAFDQRRMEAREDVLVYTSDAFKEGTEVGGPIVPTLYVSSDAKDTDFTVKVLDVYPDGRAYNLDESIQRMRYRDGYDKPQVGMESGKVYKVTLQPLNTSNDFAPVTSCASKCQAATSRDSTVT